MSTPKESLRQLLANLHAERVATWEPAALQVNINQRQTLIDNYQPSKHVQVGQKLDNFSLEEVDGKTLVLDELLAKGPVALVFFRFAGCPACNIALPYYKRQLAPALAELGATLIGVSPQVPERLVEIKRRHDLNFLVATDRDNALARRFGILYTYDEASQKASLAKGGGIGDTTGTGTWELPQPTVVLIDRDRVVRFVEVSPDWLVRSEADEIVEQVRALSAVPA